MTSALLSLSETERKETYLQLDDKEAYDQVPDNSSVRVNTFMKTSVKIRQRRDLPKDTLDYLWLKILNFKDIICYLKSKQLPDVPGRPGI